MDGSRARHVVPGQPEETVSTIEPHGGRASAPGIVVPSPRQPSGEMVPHQLSRPLLGLLRAAAVDLPERIVDLILSEVPLLAEDRRTRRAVRDAVSVALRGFLDGEPGALGHFRALGVARGRSGGTVLPVLRAIQVSADAAWETLQQVARREGLAGYVVADVGSAMSGFLQRLGDAAERGHREASLERISARALLFAVLMGRYDERPIAEIAEAARWSVPDEVVVLVAELHGVLAGDAPGLGSDVLVHHDGDRVAVLAAAAQVDGVRDTVLRWGRQVIVAEAWPVRATEASHGYRWARRALTLARERALEPVDRVLRCADHRLLLWTSADPVLARKVSADLLAPLSAVRPAYRRPFAVTLLRWLETRETALAMAPHLGVHDQTVRYRLRRLSDMFGDQLVDPEQRMGLILALRTMFPDHG